MLQAVQVHPCCAALLGVGGDHVSVMKSACHLTTAVLTTDQPAHNVSESEPK